MWWKLGGLAVLTSVMILCVIPIRSHAVLIDPTNPPPPYKWTLSTAIHNMYFTPGTLALIALILLMAVFLGVRIVRGSWRPRSPD